MALFGNSNQLREELHQCQQHVAELESMVDALSQSMSLVEFSSKGDILDANQSYLDMMGYQKSELIGKHHKTLCHDKGSDNNTDMWRRLANGETIKGMNLRRTKDNREIYVGGTYCPVFDKSGTVFKVLKIASDVTRRVQQADIQEGTVEAVSRSMAVIEFTPDATIVAANQNFLDTMGYQESEILGKEHKMFCLASFVKSSAYQGLWDKLNSGQFVSGKFECKDKSGNSVWLEASFNPIFDSRNRLIKIIKFATDITASIEAANKTNEMAYESSKQTDAISQRGIDVAKQAVVAMRQVSEGLNGASSKISDLSQQSERISSIVSTISAIADQTNLLALNAAIEAARAGDQGRGFAVVADEVRQLASRTSTSTSEIDEVVKLNNSLAGDAVLSMEKIVSDANTGVGLIEQTGDTIEEIAQSTKKMVQLISKLANTDN